MPRTGGVEKFTMLSKARRARRLTSLSRFILFCSQCNSVRSTPSRPVAMPDNYDVEFTVLKAFRQTTIVRSRFRTLIKRLCGFEELTREEQPRRPIKPRNLFDSSQHLRPILLPVPASKLVRQIICSDPSQWDSRIDLCSCWVG